VEPPTTALLPVNVTVPKSANGTSELPDSKSSTIHSAFSPHRVPCVSSVKVCDADFPVLTFSNVVVPLFAPVLVTVTLISFPDVTVRELYATDEAGIYSYQAS